MTSETPSVAFDPQALTGLRRAAREERAPAQTLKEVAIQFEALFLQMMLKGMREASPGEDLFGSDEGRFYRELYDQQLAVLLARRAGQGGGAGLGLADALLRQLGGTGRVAASSGVAIAGPAAFVRALHAPAAEAARELGVAPEALLAQAALETGWGRSVPAAPDGRSSHNLFGIKADGRWNGPRVAVPTVEYRDGVAERRVEVFRAYGSYEESFRDYVRFVQDNPRYRAALAARADAGAYLFALARAGYATDPDYGAKLERVLTGEPLRSALAALKLGGQRPLS